ncbi:MAG: methyltransferase [Pseudomonadales bacterium]|nr:methyltransferase [Pseudomonadales bacterium]
MNSPLTRFSSAAGPLELVRYPPRHQHKSLQAWDSADELLISEGLSRVGQQRPLLIINDDFGALGCAFAAFDPLWISDSEIARRALNTNLHRNDLPAVRVQDCLTPVDEVPAVVLLKIPRSLALLEYQLRKLALVLSPETIVIAGGKVKAITRSVLELFGAILGPATTSLATRKSRLIYCQPSADLIKGATASDGASYWACELPGGQTLQLENLPAVFSRQSLDIGARVLLQSMKPDTAAHIIDLGCGNGVLGINALALNPQISVTFTDESYMAVESARRNVRQNFPERITQCNFLIDNCLETFLQQPDRQPVETIYCNPPFHQHNTITDHIAWQMFHDARDALLPGGQLVIVANRHLDYLRTLRRLFGRAELVEGQHKFVVIRAIRARS